MKEMKYSLYPVSLQRERVIIEVDQDVSNRKRLMKPLLDIIIVNWNSGRQLRDCLESIAGTDRTGFQLQRVVVVDNGSTDDSIDGLNTISNRSTVIRNQRDIGYGAAANQGARGSEADYLLFLNPDIRLLSDSLVKPVQFLEQPENARVGICGIQLLADNGQVARHCVRFPQPSHFFSKIVGLDRILPRVFENTFMSEWDHTDNRFVDHVMGAFWLVRQRVFEELRGFDETFFLYLEDLDFSLRAMRAGWRTYYLADAQVYHRGSGTMESFKAERLFFTRQSRVLYAYKHFGRLSATGVMLSTFLLEPFARLAFAIAHRSKDEIVNTVSGYSMLWGASSSIVKTALALGRDAQTQEISLGRG